MVFIFEIANFDLLLMLLSDKVKIFSFEIMSMGLCDDDATSHIRFESNIEHEFGGETWMTRAFSFFKIVISKYWRNE